MRNAPCERDKSLLLLSSKTGHIARAPKEKKPIGIHIGRHIIPIPWVSLVLILLNIAMGIYKLSTDEIAVLFNFGMQKEALQQGEYLRLILGGFLHLNLLHLASNMYGLVIYGFLFENRIGKWRYLLI